MICFKYLIDFFFFVKVFFDSFFNNHNQELKKDLVDNIVFN